MSKEIAVRKRWLLKITGVCIIAAAAYCLFNAWSNIKSYKESENIIKDAISKQLNKSPKELISVDFEKVEEIDISSFRIKNLKPIEKLKDIKSINIMANQKIDLRPLEKLENLETLKIFFPGAMTRKPSMSENFRHRISHPSGNSRISSIAVPFDLYRLRNFKNLKSLIIRAKYVKNIAALSGLTNMKHLEIETSYMNYYDIQSISSLINLEYLGLQNSTYWTYISPLENLNNLQRLDLSGAHISDPNSLKKLTGLKSLKVINTQLSEEQIAELQKALPDLNIER